jgi:hypothetical protein
MEVKQGQYPASFTTSTTTTHHDCSNDINASSVERNRILSTVVETLRVDSPGCGDNNPQFANRDSTQTDVNNRDEPMNDLECELVNQIHNRGLKLAKRNKLLTSCIRNYKCTMDT